MCARPYDTLAHVYEWLIPDDLLTPTGSAAVFATLLEPLERSARILDCAAGTGQLAVGLAAMGFSVVATDASTAMIQRTRALADAQNVELTALTCSWEELPSRRFEHFDAVFCIGNSLAHAAGHAGRRAALAAMSVLLRNDGLLVVTSRNWETVRSRGSRIEVGDRTIERHGRPGLVVHAWTIPDSWEQPHSLDVAVALLDSLPAVTTNYERLTFWPFTHQTLKQDLHAAGLTPGTSTYTSAAERYLITAHKRTESQGPNRNLATAPR
ncbi:MAG: class I SAM-dependent methyltransferase [Solirubrobacterales bacterium]|nr:class I SAM-dependent methyltransferase [Solirubrobacterales bacterium]